MQRSLPAMRRAREVVSVGAFLATACNLSGPSETRDEAAARKYMGVMAARASVNVEVERCKMFDGTRKGYCLLEGTASDFAKFVSDHGLQPTPLEPRFGNACPQLPGWGRQVDDHFEANGGTQRFRPLTRALPVNHNNVHFRELYVAPSGSACVEYDFPYG